MAKWRWQVQHISTFLSDTTKTFKIIWKNCDSVFFFPFLFSWYPPATENISLVFVQLDSYSLFLLWSYIFFFYGLHANILCAHFLDLTRAPLPLRSFFFCLLFCWLNRSVLLWRLLLLLLLLLRPLFFCAVFLCLFDCVTSAELWLGAVYLSHSLALPLPLPLLHSFSLSFT